MPRIHVSGALTNRGSEPWSAAQGDALGWQLYDPESGLFLAEGEWRGFEKPVAPGETLPVEWDVDLPAESGDYRLYASAVNPSAGWAYARGEEFLLVDAVVGGGEAQVVRRSNTTLARMRVKRRISGLGRVFTEPFAMLARNRGLMRSMVRRDIMARYRGSFGDALWTILNPLLLMLAYFFVFGVVLRARFAGDPSPAGFVLYFLAGMMPWLAFSEAVARAPVVLLEYRNFIKKIRFPVETLPANLVFSGLLTQFFATLIFLALLLWARGAIPPSIAWLPVLLVPQILFTLGLCWLLASLGIFVRDLAQLMGFILTLWFFLTPICYPEASLPPAALPWLGKNPFFLLVRGYRAILLENRAPDAVSMVVLWMVGFACFFVGYAVFAKLRRSFADIL
jgi:lipopolysaccharide transport system permease protein